MSDSLDRISPQQPVSSRTSRSAACSCVSRASTCPLGSDQTRGSPLPMSRASKEPLFRRRTSPPAETSYLIRIALPERRLQPDVFGLVFSSISRGPKKDTAHARLGQGIATARDGSRYHTIPEPKSTGPEVG